MIRLVVNLPGPIVELLAPTPGEAAVCLQQLALIDLFRRGEVSSGWAAEKLGIGKSEFIDLLAEHGVPYFNLSPEDLSRDVEAVRAYVAPDDRPRSQTADR